MEKFSSAWKMLKLTGGQFCVERNAPGHKKLILFKKLNPFPGGKYLNLMNCSLFERERLCIGGVEGVLTS